MAALIALSLLAPLLVAALLNYGLAVINLGLLGWWFLHERPQWGFLLLVPLTALVLSPQQEVNWIANFHSAWHYAVMFALLAMLMITRQPQSFANVVWAAVFALLASFSLLVGFATWGVILLGLWLMGYRRWQVYAFWLLVIAVVAVVYLNIPGIDPGQGALLDEGDALVQSVRITDYAFFIITFLGNSFAYGYDSNILIPMFMSVLGIGVFAVTAGLGADEIVARHERDNDPYAAIMVKALADRLAEALAEWLHQRARREWGYGRDEALAIGDLIREKYRGIRPAPGYPACPDHTEKRLLFELLGGEEKVGIRLTESFAMLPAASVCGFYFAHPQARYFALGKIGRDQVEDYHRRKGMDLATVERWLAPNLGY